MGLAFRDGIRSYEQSGLEVDNCEIFGWSWGGVDLVSTSGQHSYIHHNYFHHIYPTTMGYAVNFNGATALVEGNIFDYVKNPIAGTGTPTEGYEFRYNIVKHTTTLSHQIDVHPYSYNGQTIAGKNYRIHHNTVLYGNIYAVGIYGVPLEGVWIDHNKFQWTVENGGKQYSPVFQHDGKGKVFMTRNLIADVLYEEGPVYYW
jgi:hypothetical protein